MPVDTSLYQNRTPPDPIAGLGGTVGLANALTQNQMLNAQNRRLQGEVQGQGEFGQAVKDANGDPIAAMNMFTQRGGNSLYAPQALSTATGIQGGQISNLNAGAGGNQAQTSDALAAANSIAAAPNAKRADILNELGARLHNGLISQGAYHAIVDNMPANDKAAVNYVKTKTQGMVAAPAQVEPVTAGVNEDLTPKVVSGATAIKAAAQPGGFAGGAPPGAPEVAAGDRKALFEDQLRASGTMANARPLQQSLPLIQQLSNQNFGPGSPEFAKIKGALTTAGIIDPNTSDLQVRQELNKYLLKYSSGAISAGRSDAALSAAIGSNPNLDLTQPANLALVKNQIGYDRMDAAMPKAFGVEGKPGTYSEYKAGYYQANDPRAFGFDLMTPDERAKVKASLGAPGSPAYQKFLHSYNLAKSSGMLTTPGGAQ